MMASYYYDTFTAWLRYAIVVTMACIFLFVVGAVVGGMILRWYRRRQLERHERIYDWQRDGECDADLGWHDRSHVHLLDVVPKEWMQEWN